MKKLIIFLTLISISNLTAQTINLKLIYQVINVDFKNMDELMVKGYGFEKIDNEEPNIKKYLKLYNNKSNYAISIIRYNKNLANEDAVILSISLAKGYSTRKIKDDLVQDGFIYTGYIDKLDLSGYKKGKLIFAFKEHPNNIGAKQILIMTSSQ